MMRILKRIFLALFILIVLLVISGSLIVHLYGDEIKIVIVENINKNLKTDVEVREVDFTIWENFPKASVVFSNVVIHAVDAKNDTLLSAKKISAQFDLADIYQKRYRLIALEISDGLCYMQVDNSGKENYIFWNETENDTSSFSTELEKVKIENIDFQYSNYSKKIDVVFNIKKAAIRGQFSNSQSDLEIQTDLETTHIQLGEMSFFENRSLLLDVEGAINQDSRTIEFNNANFTVDAIAFSVLGQYEYSGLNNLDIKISTIDSDLSRAIGLLPSAIREKFQRFKIDGSASFQGEISGKISSPAYNFLFSVNDGALKDKATELSFVKTSLNGSITNGSQKGLSSTELIIENFESKLSHGKIKGEFKVVNFINPQYSYQGKVSFELKELVDLMKWNQLSEVNGNIETDVSISGGMNEVGKYTIDDWSTHVLLSE